MCSAGRTSAIAMGITSWALAIVVLAATILPADHYLISYYVVDYAFGFVRRGLAGTLVGPVGEEGFFGRALTARWLLSVIYLLGLAAMITALARRNRSRRRTMLALLIPVLPFGVPYAVYSARPDLLGATVLIGLSLALAGTRRPRHAAACCAGYGLVVGVLVFVHEGIAFEFPLGAILAIHVLAEGLDPTSQRLCAAFAVIPGLVSALAVAGFARHDVSAKVCRTVPHHMLANPLAAPKNLAQLEDGVFGAKTNLVDYHDWVCGWYLTTYDYGVGDGLRAVLAIGPAGLALSSLLGLTVICTSIGAVRYVSHVPFSAMVTRVRRQWPLPLLGLALAVPMFLTGVDWTRWLLAVAFDIVVVYLLFALRSPEVDEPPCARTIRYFPIIVTGFALIPLGLVPGSPTI